MNDSRVWRHPHSLLAGLIVGAVLAGHVWLLAAVAVGCFTVGVVARELVRGGRRVGGAVWRRVTS